MYSVTLTSFINEKRMYCLLSEILAFITATNVYRKRDNWKVTKQFISFYTIWTL